MAKNIKSKSNTPNKKRKVYYDRDSSLTKDLAKRGYNAKEIASILKANNSYSAQIDKMKNSREKQRQSLEKFKTKKNSQIELAKIQASKGKTADVIKASSLGATQLGTVVGGSVVSNAAINKNNQLVSGGTSAEQETNNKTDIRKDENDLSEYFRG